MILSSRIELNAVASDVRALASTKFADIPEAKLVPPLRPSFQIRRALRWLKLHLARAITYLVRANQEAADLHDRIYNEKEQYFARYGYYIRGIH